MDAKPGRRTLKRGAVALAVIAVAGLLGYGYYRTEADDGQGNQYRSVAVTRGPIVSSVSATGTLAAVVTVEVSSQVSGQIKEIAIDFNSIVTKDQVIARIAPETFEARVREADGDLAVARADVIVKKAALERARADIENARAGQQASRAEIDRFRAAADDARRDFDRKRQLQQSGVMATSQVERAQSVLDQARAQQAGANAQERALGSQVSSKVAALRMAEAEVEHAEALVGQKSAVLLRNQVDLDRTIIRSPIDGIVIGRSADVGQTVAASLAAPTLFTIAQDLHDMQVNVNIDEADIGRIRAGQRAMFTVDAFGGREFDGRVQQIRKAPQTVQNVVTYTVVVTAENPDLILLPGMTANVKIVVDEKRDVLRVPNAALRFRPPGIEAGGQTASAAPAASSPAPATGGGGGATAEERLQRLTETLALTPEQQTSIRAIFAGTREQMQAMRRQGASSEDIQAAARANRDRTREAIRAVLTPEQRTKFEAMNAGRAANPSFPATVWVLDDQGRPSALRITVGAGDGQLTEVVAGALKDGQEVVVGLSETPRRQSARRSPF